MLLQKIKKPFHFILFGASGDLAKLKIFPALYELALQKRFPEEYVITGFARTDLGDAGLRRLFKESVAEKHGKNIDPKTLEAILSHTFFVRGDYTNEKDYAALARKGVDTVAYLGVPPLVFEPIIERLAGIREKRGGSLKIILEKPFGENEATATELYHFVSRYFDMKDVYLLDHYLGKSSVQSILPLRYNNTILDVLLKGAVVDNIQITAVESVGVEKRIGYFEAVGIIKDMIQSHLLQILSLFTLSMPVKQNEESIRREKVHILSSLRYGDTPCGLVLGQYKGYLKEKGVAKGSTTPTFAAVRFFIDLTDWYKVPLYIRTGKKLAHKHTYVTIEFKKPAFHASTDSDGVDCNRLVIELYPEEKIQLRFLNDEGKSIAKSREVISAESLACTGDDCLPEHGRLILDAMLGKHENFLSFEEIIAAWKFTDSLERCASEHHIPVHVYDDGGDGPIEQHDLTKRDNNRWYDADRS